MYKNNDNEDCVSKLSSFRMHCQHTHTHKHTLKAYPLYTMYPVTIANEFYTMYSDTIVNEFYTMYSVTIAKELYTMYSVTITKELYTLYSIIPKCRKQDHSIWPLTGMVIWGSLISPFSHSSKAFSAALSASLVQLRNSSVGRWLKLLQNDRPLQPSWQGSSTESR